MFKNIFFFEKLTCKIEIPTEPAKKEKKNSRKPKEDRVRTKNSTEKPKTGSMPVPVMGRAQYKYASSGPISGAALGGE
jgi:hypothetical protein